jgi:hypothetical protein
MLTLVNPISERTRVTVVRLEHWSLEIKNYYGRYANLAASKWEGVEGRTPY